MNRVAWTDERLDDLANRMDAGFDRVDTEIRELRAELRTEIGALRAEISGLGSTLRAEIGELDSSLRRDIGELDSSLRRDIGGLDSSLRHEIGAVRAEIGGLRLTLLRVGGGIMIGLVGVIAAILVSPTT